MPKSFLNKITDLTNKLDNSIDLNTKLINALNCSNEGIAILDSDGKYLWLNQMHEKMFGYNYKELIGRSWETLYLKKDLKYFHKKVFPYLAKNKKWQGEINGISKDGKKIIKQMVYLTLLEDGGLICTCIKKN